MGWKYDHYADVSSEHPFRSNVLSRYPLLDREDCAEEELEQAWDDWMVMLERQAKGDYWLRLEDCRELLGRHPRVKVLRTWDETHVHAHYEFVTYCNRRIYTGERALKGWLGEVIENLAYTDEVSDVTVHTSGKYL